MRPRQAGQNSPPAFDFNPSDAGGGAAGRVDWSDRFRGGWGTYLSPFGNGAAKSAQNFTDFLAKVIGSDGDESGDGGSKFDKMGSSLNSSKYTKPGKGAGR